MKTQKWKGFQNPRIGKSVPPSSSILNFYSLCLRCSSPTYPTSTVGKTNPPHKAGVPEVSVTNSEGVLHLTANPDSYSSGFPLSKKILPEILNHCIIQDKFLPTSFYKEVFSLKFILFCAAVNIKYCREEIRMPDTSWTAEGTLEQHCTQRQGRNSEKAQCGLHSKSR